MSEDGPAEPWQCVGLCPVRSPRAQTLETWPSTAQLILVHCSDKNMHSPGRHTFWYEWKTGGDFPKDNGVSHFPRTSTYCAACSVMSCIRACAMEYGLYQEMVNGFLLMQKI